MSTQKVVMVLERSSADLDYKKQGDDYILEGIFTEFGKENNNKRIYEEKEYLPHLEHLKKKISSGSLFGELDHPDKFDVQLSKASHLIEHLEYVPEKRHVYGRIKLMDTENGKNAIAILNSGGKLSISSRAAGTVNENKKVSIRKVFTYDLVADPGFESAQLNKVNEELGYESDGDIAIYEMENFDLDKFGEEKNIYSLNSNSKKENKKENKFNMTENVVTVDVLNKYSEHIKERFDSIESKLNKNSDVSEIVKDVNDLKTYVQYLSENVVEAINEKESINLKDVVSHLDYVVENMNKFIDHSDYLVENINVLNENQKNQEMYNDYIAENLDKAIEHGDHIVENTNKLIDYSEFIAENLDKGLQHQDYLAENINRSINFGNYISEQVNNSIAYSESIAEGINEGVGTGSFGVKSNNLSEKVDAILESVKKQTTSIQESNLAFPQLHLLSEQNKKKFLLLENNQKQKVIDSVKNQKAVSEQQFLAIWNESLRPKTEEDIYERLLSNMPDNLKPIWESLDGKTRQRILDQADYYNFTSNDYSMRTFWQTRKAMNEQAEYLRLNESKMQVLNESKNIKESEVVTDYKSEYKNAVVSGLKRY